MFDRLKEGAVVSRTSIDPLFSVLSVHHRDILTSFIFAQRPQIPVLKDNKPKTGAEYRSSKLWRPQRRRWYKIRDGTSKIARSGRTSYVASLDSHGELNLSLETWVQRCRVAQQS